MADIKENIEIIRANIEKTCNKAGRNSADVTILAASKKAPPSKIKEAFFCGITDFGESYYQEARDKMPNIEENITWHFIGHLQKNKVNHVVSSFELIHSVDSLDLITKIDKSAQNIDKIQKILLEVNIAGEDTKFGLNEERLFKLVNSAQELKNIKICGLMTMPP
ncbi:MAG: YggS family pyridoxal phosphate-dependent enzyme, partial [Armatimonadota bacterium]